MSRYCYVVLSDPVTGREEEFNNWYDDQHVPDALRVPGFVSAQRFKVSDANSTLPGQYLTLYEIETNDLQRVLDDVRSRAGTPAMVLSDAADFSSTRMAVFEAITEKAYSRK